MGRDLRQQFVWLSSYSFKQQFYFVTNTVRNIGFVDLTEFLFYELLFVVNDFGDLFSCQERSLVSTYMSSTYVLDPLFSHMYHSRNILVPLLHLVHLVDAVQILHVQYHVGLIPFYLVLST